MEADITSQAVGLASNTDFSITTLFLRADIIVKSVIIILIASSIYSWAIIFEKIKLFLIKKNIFYKIFIQYSKIRKLKYLNLKYDGCFINNYFLNGIIYAGLKRYG